MDIAAMSKVICMLFLFYYFCDFFFDGPTLIPISAQARRAHGRSSGDSLVPRVAAWHAVTVNVEAFAESADVISSFHVIHYMIII